MTDTCLKEDGYKDICQKLPVEGCEGCPHHEHKTHIYFAHAIVDYNSEYEDLCIKTINQFHKGCIIHNPKEIDKILDESIPNEEKFISYFLPEVDKCDMVIAAPAFNSGRKGQFLRGTTREILHALKNKKPVVAIINNKLKDINEGFFNNLIDNGVIK